jgi:exopolyphosphatase/guanosine-5'-triphosphate,3'-diphosphate pyrophosphatase
MVQRAAIIDLGSNTFHQLIVEWEGRQFKTLSKLQIPVKIGKSTFKDGWIQEDAFQRGITAIKEFKALIDENHVDMVEIYGTSALRIAANAKIFQDEVESILNTPIRIIDGNVEAELIYNGVRHAVPLGDEAHLIMDIGGGSVEFIIADEKHIFWRKSYEIGVSRLTEKYYLTDPIDDLARLALETYLEVQLKTVWQRAAKYNVRTLVGSSGTFESISDIDMEAFHSQKQTFPFVHHLMDLSHYTEIKNRIIKSTKAELEVLPGLIQFRVEMIVVGMILIDYVMRRITVKKLIISDYALKEGIMFKLMKGEASTIHR